MLKRIFSILLAAILIVTGCASRQQPSGEIKSESGSLSAPAVPETPASAPTNTSSEVPAEAAVFALDLQGKDQKAMSVGDTLGDWTLTELKIDYSKANNTYNMGNISMLTAVFTGNVTLKGTLTRNGLVDVGYDFSVSKEDEEKMPRYISSEMEARDNISSETEVKDNFMFMLDFPDDIAKTLDLPHGEKKECRVTISSYRFIFAYMTAPPCAAVVNIEML